MNLAQFNEQLISTATIPIALRWTMKLRSFSGSQSFILYKFTLWDAFWSNFITFQIHRQLEPLARLLHLRHLCLQVWCLQKDPADTLAKSAVTLWLETNIFTVQVWLTEKGHLITFIPDDSHQHQLRHNCKLFIVWVFFHIERKRNRCAILHTVCNSMQSLILYTVCKSIHSV